MTSEEAYKLFEAIVQINGLENNIVKYAATEEKRKMKYKMRRLSCFPRKKCVSMESMNMSFCKGATCDEFKAYVLKKSMA